MNEDVIQDGDEEGCENGMNMGEDEDPEGCIINEWTENDNDFLPFIEQENICLNLDSDQEWDLDEDCKDKDMKEESFEWPEMSFDEEFQENNEYMEKAEYNDKVEHVKDPIENVIDEEKVGKKVLKLVVSKPLGPYSTDFLGEGCSSWGPYSRDSLNSGRSTALGLWNEETTYCEAKMTEDEEEEVYSHQDIVDSFKEESIEEEVNLEHIDDFIEDNLGQTDNKEEEIYSHENILDSVKKSSMEKEVKLEVIDDLVEDNLGQPVPLVMVKDEVMEEKIKKFVKIKSFPWWPAFFKQEGNIATFLDNQIGHPLEVMDFTDANKEWILSRVHFSKKTASNKAAFLCDYAKISNM